MLLGPTREEHIEEHNRRLAGEPPPADRIGAFLDGLQALEREFAPAHAELEELEARAPNHPALVDNPYSRPRVRLALRPLRARPA